jgi:hypothetical protein
MTRGEVFAIWLMIACLLLGGAAGFRLAEAIYR